MRASGHSAALKGYSDPALLRGGRMTKWKGRAASCAPSFGQLVVTVSYVALAAGVGLMPGAAFAGSCTAFPASVCSGAASGTGADAQISLTTAGPAPLTLNTTAGFGNDASATAGTAGLRIDGNVAGAFTFTDANNATIRGSMDGLIVNNTANNAAGSTTIVTSGAITGGSRYGLFGLDRSTGNLTISTSGAVTGGTRGIVAFNYNAGATSVTNTAAVTATGATGVGIYSQQSASGGTTVDVQGAVTGGLHGVRVYNAGTGGASTVNVTTSAAVTGGTNGVMVNNLRGDVSVTTGPTVTGTNGVGVRVSNGNGAGANQAGPTSVTTGDVVGGLQGILANQVNGTGNITITANGTVTASTGTGIQTRDYVGGAGTASGSVTVNAGTTTGRVNGILATNDGAGNLTIVATGNTSSGAVAGTSLRGISATNSGVTAGSLSVSATNVTGQTNGLYASNVGSGGTVVNISGNTSGTTSVGLDARDSGAGGLSVTTVGTVTGTTGINASNGGGGNLTVQTTGAVTGTAGAGLDAIDTGAGNISVTAGAATGGTYGVRARNQGGGAMTVQVSGHAQGGSGDGVRAQTDVNNTDLTVTTATASGNGHGVAAMNYGTGATQVTTNGLSQGTVLDGLFTRSAGTTLTINAAAVSGGRNGIETSHSGSGLATINANGTVNAGTGDGVRGISLSGNGVQVVTQGTINAGLDAIRTANTGAGNGDIAITSYQSATGGRNGIFASTVAGAQVGSISIDARASVSGVATGIDATNTRQGAITITAAGPVSASGVTGVGIRATGAAVCTDVSIAAAAVSGGQDGISVTNNGTGTTEITATAAVTGTSGTGVGMTEAGAGNARIQTEAVTGGVSGIVAVATGGGDLAIEARGLANGGSAGTGIAAIKTGAGNLTVASVGARAGTGISAANTGAGDVSLTLAATAAGNGDVTGIVGRGIDLRNTGGAGALTLTQVGTTTGATDGVFLSQASTGGVSATLNGAVNGQNGNGLQLAKSATGAATIVAQSTVTGSTNGVEASSGAGGDMTVTTNAQVTGTAATGVRVSSSGGTGTMQLTTNGVLGGTYGIFALKSDLGDAIVQANGLTRGGSNHGIYAQVGASGGSLSITAVDVTGSSAGGRKGIQAFGDGSGSVLVRSTGTVTGNEGIYARAAGTTLTVDTQGVVTGTTNGIVARSTGTGLMTLQTAGIVTGAGGFGIYGVNDGSNALRVDATAAVVGTSGDGIFVRNGATATAMTLTATTVTGGQTGINARNNGTGALAITATGTATGGSGSGIDARNAASGTSLTVNAASASGGQSGINALNAGTAATQITVAAGGVVQGNVSGITASHASAAAFDIVVNGEVRNSSGATTALAIQATSTGRGVTLQNNSNTIIGTVNLTAADDVFNNPGSWLTAGGTSDFGGGNDLLNNTATGLIDVADVAGTAELTTFNALEQFTNAGRVSLQDGGVGDRLVTTGNYTGAGGTLLIDALLQTGGTADVLRVDGNVTGTTLLAVANAGGTGGVTTGDGILVVDVGGTSTGNAFSLAGPLNVGTTRYSLDFGGAANTNQNWYLVARSNGGDTLWEAVPAIFLKDMPTLQQRVGERIARPDADTTRAPWVRLKGGMGNVDPRLSDAGAAWSYASRDLQVGFDSEELVTNGGAWVFGATAQYGGTEADVFNAAAIGTVKGQSYGLGATATWYGNNGLYADFQGQANRVSARFEGTTGNELADRQGLGSYVLSSEVGWRKEMKGGSAIVPQAQLVYATLDGGSFASTLGSQVDLGDNERLTGRVGLAWEHLRKDGSRYYMLGNLEKNLNGQTGVTVDGNASRQTNDVTFASMGFGATAAFDDNKSGYFEGSYKAAIGEGSGGNDAFGLTAGLRIQW